MGFRKISIQEELVVAIENVMAETGTYRSIAEFISEAVRLRLETIQKQQKKTEEKRKHTEPTP
jgi:Arc/MetJ-type ribon-helix-helix transcriptional regulator